MLIELTKLFYQLSQSFNTSIYKTLDINKKTGFKWFFKWENGVINSTHTVLTNFLPLSDPTLFRTCKRYQSIVIFE